jgi:hypothetical protein
MCVCVYYDTILVTCLKRIDVISMTGQYHKLRRLVAGLIPRWLGFDNRSGHVNFMEEEVTVGQVFYE